MEYMGTSQASDKCGKEFFGSPQNCPECGSILDEQKNETAPNANPSPYPYPYPQNSGGYPNQPPVQQAKSSKTWIIVVVAIVAAIAVVVTGAIFVFNYIEKENGKKELELLLLRDWSRIEESNGVYYTLELDFSGSSIKYNFVDEIYGLYNETIATYKYEVISPDEILVKRTNSDAGTVYSLSFNDDETMMIMTPSLTDSEDKEYWYYH